MKTRERWRCVVFSTPQMRTKNKSQPTNPTNLIFYLSLSILLLLLVLCSLFLTRVFHNTRSCVSNITNLIYLLPLLFFFFLWFFFFLFYPHILTFLLLFMSTCNILILYIFKVKYKIWITKIINTHNIKEIYIYSILLFIELNSLPTVS